MLTEDYRPTSRDEIVGNEKAVRTVWNWVSNWDSTFDPLLLYGPPGVGKTTTARVAAEENGREINEVNASRDRSYDALLESIVEPVQTRTYSYNPRMVILDEADTLGSSGSRAVHKALDEVNAPFVLIVNDLYDGVSKSIRNKCREIEFDYIDDSHIRRRIREIIDAEGKECSEDIVSQIVADANGDMRAAINNLSSVIARMESKTVDKEEKADIRVFSSDGELFWLKDDIEDVTEEEWEWVKDQLQQIKPIQRTLVVGPRDHDPVAARRVCREWLSGEYDEWIIPAYRGFCMTVAEYAREHQQPYRLVLPQIYEKHTEGWTLEEKEQLISLYAPSEGVGVVCTNIEYDPDWVYNAMCFGVDAVHGWVREDSFVTDLWEYARGEVVNLAHIHDFVLSENTNQGVQS